MIFFSVLNNLKWEVAVCFVDIVYVHCLNFLFITNYGHPYGNIRC